ncbi:MAG: carbohydrate-binding family 9-like protein [Planctomycetota bacterium]
MMLALFFLLIAGAEPDSIIELYPGFSPRRYVCYRTESPLCIDGRIDEEAWQEAGWTEEFVDIEGPAKPAPLFRTQATMLWDDDYFYVAARLDEPHLWANLTKRDSVIFYDNDFELFIDPDGDTHRYYELEMNALNTVWDLFLDRPYRDQGCAVFCWDMDGLKTGVHLDGTLNNPTDTDKGWSVEIAIPWSVLNECAGCACPPEQGDQWRLGFSRVEWQVEVEDGRYEKVKDPKTGKSLPEYNWVWSPQGAINMHMPERWGFVQFSEKVAGTGTDGFVFNPAENAKWVLRQVYYAQGRYFEKHNAFTSDLTALGILPLKAEGFVWPPEIRQTWSLFEARLESREGSDAWHIDNLGRVWRSSR